MAALVDTNVLVYRADGRGGLEQRRAEALPLYSEDFQHDRLYGTVRVINPFV